MNRYFGPQGRVSVVIPTLNEAGRIGPLIESLRRERELREIIVADGGSTDDTVSIAERLGTRLVTSDRGRGQQLRAGAAAARGEFLLFLHADSVFPQGGLSAITEVLDHNAVVAGGNFQVDFDGDTRFARWLTAIYAWIRRFALYYGDSGIFVRRAVYEALGGFQPIALMEDYEFVRRLERAGTTCRIDDPPLVASSRRFERRRPATIITIWALIQVLYWAGISPERLARMYSRNARGSDQRTSMRRQSS